MHHCADINELRVSKGGGGKKEEAVSAEAENTKLEGRQAACHMVCFNMEMSMLLGRAAGGAEARGTITNPAVTLTSAGPPPVNKPLR